MDVAGFRPHLLGHTAEKSDHIVLDFSLDLMNPLDIKARLLADDRDGFSRNFSPFRQDLAGGDLHIQPAGKARLIGKKCGHFRPAVT